ncbi:MAG TPA: hypothetical protein VNW99_08630 [Cytophagaceae bacterium]|jgi:hypothetical protein|nr:hypothetical protein [Cytophagaceae bacterium]
MMKTFKPLLLIVAGISIALLFAFKNNSVTNEFLIIKKSDAKLKVYTAGSLIKEVKITGYSYEEELSALLNTLGQEGWSIKISYVEQAGINLFVDIYLERPRQ